MTPVNKPEWFQMAEADGPKPVRAIKRGTRIVALTAPLILVGVGFVVAQTNDGGPALAGGNQTLVQQSSQKLSAIATPSSIGTSAGPIQPPTGHDDNEGFEGEDD